MPATGIFKGPLLHTLVFTDSHPPLDLDFALQADVRIRWSTLEDSLLRISTFLEKNSRSLLSEIRETRIKLPSEFGLAARHKSANDGLRTLKEAQNAFFLLIARTSALIACTESSTPRGTYKGSWASSLVQEDPAAVHFIDKIRNSAIGTFSSEYRRVGAFMDTSDYPVRLIPALKYAQVPLWLRWDIDNLQRILMNKCHNFLQDFVPSPELLDLARKYPTVTSQHVALSKGVFPSGSSAQALHRQAAHWEDNRSSDSQVLPSLSQYVIISLCIFP
jgi:hypothetical protein